MRLRDVKLTKDEEKFYSRLSDDDIKMLSKKSSKFSLPFKFIFYFIFGGLITTLLIYFIVSTFGENKSVKIIEDFNIELEKVELTKEEKERLKTIKLTESDLVTKDINKKLKAERFEQFFVSKDEKDKYHVHKYKVVHVDGYKEDKTTSTMYRPNKKLNIKNDTTIRFFDNLKGIRLLQMDKTDVPQVAVYNGVFYVFSKFPSQSMEFKPLLDLEKYEDKYIIDSALLKENGNGIIGNRIIFSLLLSFVMTIFLCFASIFYRLYNTTILNPYVKVIEEYSTLFKYVRATYFNYNKKRLLWRRGNSIELLAILLGAFVMCFDVMILMLVEGIFNKIMFISFILAIVIFIFIKEIYVVIFLKGTYEFPLAKFESLKKSEQKDLTNKERVRIDTMIQITQTKVGYFYKKKLIPKDVKLKLNSSLEELYKSDVSKFSYDELSPIMDELDRYQK